MKRTTIEHLELWRKFKGAKTRKEKEDTKRQLIELYYPLVRKISFVVAKKLEWRVSPDELSSFGVDGLYVAIDRFNIERGITFPSYASIRIRGSMIDGIRKEDIVPRSVRINYHKLDEARKELQAEKGGIIGEAEIAERAGFDPDDLLRNGKKYTPVSFTSIDGSDICGEEKHEDYKSDLNDNLVDGSTQAADSKILRREFFCKLLSKGFSRTEQQIMYMYYYEDLTMDVIADRLGMSESRVSQLHKDVLPRLRDKIERNPSYFNSDITRFIVECNNRGTFLD